MITSQDFSSYPGLDGDCPDDIECFAVEDITQSLYDNGYSDYDFEIDAVRVIGSRMTQDLYRDDSDLDILVVFDGSIREDDMFNILHEYEHTWNGHDIDYFPEKDRTLEEMLELDYRRQEEKR